jgi:hypothetical protein
VPIKHAHQQTPVAMSGIDTSTPNNLTVKQGLNGLVSRSGRALDLLRCESPANSLWSRLEAVIQFQSAPLAKRFEQGVQSAIEEYQHGVDLARYDRA